MRPPYLILVDYLVYNKETGVFTWKVDYRTFKQGEVAGIKSNGYVKISLLGFQYQAQDLAWLYETKEWPNSLVDHIDRDKSNNRFSNLRLATKSQNALNSDSWSNTGKKGITYKERDKVYVVRIRIEGKTIFVGQYKTEQEAIEARALAVNKHPDKCFFKE